MGQIYIYILYTIYELFGICMGIRMNAIFQMNIMNKTTSGICMGIKRDIIYVVFCATVKELLGCNYLGLHTLCWMYLMGIVWRCNWIYNHQCDSCFQRFQTGGSHHSP